MAVFWGAFAPPADGIFGAGVATLPSPFGPGDPETGLLTAPVTAVEGDVYVQGGAGLQLRRVGGAWVQIPAGENRADVFAISGGANDRVTKFGGQPFRAVWRSSAEGVIQMWNQTTAETVWNIQHNLTARMVDVKVIAPGYSVTVTDQGRIPQPGVMIPLAPPQDILVPEIDYVGANNVVLTFQEAVAGTAIVRR